MARKVGLERPFKRTPHDPADNTSGGFNQQVEGPERRGRKMTEQEIRMVAYALAGEERTARRPRQRSSGRPRRRRLNRSATTSIFPSGKDLNQPPVQAGLRSTETEQNRRQRGTTSSQRCRPATAAEGSRTS